MEEDTLSNEWLQLGYTEEQIEELNIISKLNNVDNINAISIEEMTSALQKVMNGLPEEVNMEHKCIDCLCHQCYINFYNKTDNKGVKCFDCFDCENHKNHTKECSMFSTEI